MADFDDENKENKLGNSQPASNSQLKSMHLKNLNKLYNQVVTTQQTTTTKICRY